MTTTIYLIRHAAHAHLGAILSGRLPDIPLSAMGRSQARVLADGLRSVSLAGIFTSPVQRARETAAGIATGRADRVPVTIAPELDEVDFGAWQGCRFDALVDDPDWHRWNAERGTATPPGGEAMHAVQARLMRFAAAIAAQHDGSAVAFVSHCDVIRAGIAGWLGLPMDHLLRFDIDPASISRVDIGAWGARIMSVNEGAGRDDARVGATSASVGRGLGAVGDVSGAGYLAEPQGGTHA